MDTARSVPTSGSPSLTLYDHPLSGNCHKVRLLLSFLKLPYRRIFLDVLNGKNQTKEFSHLNPLKQIPVLTDGTNVIWDSQAILVFLSSKYNLKWLSNNSLELAHITQWLSFSSNEISNTLQLARLHYILNEDVDIFKINERAIRILDIIDSHLHKRDWIAAEHPTIADIACFPYIALAREGHLPLDDYNNILSWINRFSKLEGYITMPGLD